MNIIYNARIAKGMTPKQVADACGVNILTYKRWEALQPTPKTAIIIPHAKRRYVCHVLGIKRKELDALMLQLTRLYGDKNDAR